MVKRSLLKNTYREILRSPGRFLAIFGIIALGSGFFVGLRVTRDAMVMTANEYLDKTAFYDFAFVSTLGYTDDEVAALKKDTWLSDAEGAFRQDALVEALDGDEHVYSFLSLPRRINVPDLHEGRFPESANECLADDRLFGVKIGDTVTLSDENDADTFDRFSSRQFTVVGKCESPLYLNFERGNTALGAGEVSGFIYLLPDAFEADYYTTLYVKTPDMGDAYTDIYEENCARLKVTAETRAKELGRSRYDNLLRDYQDEIADGEQEYEDGLEEYQTQRKDAEEELDDAYNELRDARQELDDGWEKLEDARKTLARERTNGAREIADAEQELSDALKKLEDGEAEYEDGAKQFADGEQQYADGAKKIADGKSAYQSGADSYDAGMAQYRQGLAEWQAASDDFYNTQKPQLEAGIAYWEGQIASLDPSDPAYDTTLASWQAQLQGLRETLAGGEAQILEAKSRLDQTASRLSQAKAQLDASASELSAGEKELADSRQKLDESRAELEQARADLDSGWQDYRQGLADLEEAKTTYQEEIASAERDIRKAERELLDGEEEYADAEKEYDKARKEADEEFVKAEEELKDAKEELDDAKEKLADLKEPTVIVMDRESNVGYVCLESDADIVRNVSNVFPVFFVLVAALICMTTVRRMVEEQRGQIGVLSALGYSRIDTMGKYLTYALAATVSGSLAGILFGSFLFPTMIWKAYSIIYYFSDSLTYYLNVPLSVMTFALYVLAMLLVTYLSLRATLRETPAAVLRPRPPKSGKRVALERVGFLWRRLSFMWKVTMRNIFRYKERVLMMTLGVGGCAALMLTGFGISDSIQNVVDYQYDEIETYEYDVLFAEDPGEEGRARFTEEAASRGGDTLFLHQTSLSVQAKGKNKSAHLTVIPEQERIADFFLMKNGNETVAYPKTGEVVINIGLAQDLGLKEGDVISVTIDDVSHDFPISGIFDNYIYNYVILDAETYAAATGHDASLECAWIRVTGEAPDLAAFILNEDKVLNLTSADTMKERIGSIMDNMVYIVLLTIICAAALAFIVIYNLTNINITERMREIATVKVLGFYPGEAAGYVLRENILLTVLGALIGIPLGIALNTFVIHTIKVDLVYFAPHIIWKSYIYCVLLTFLFGGLVDLFMMWKLGRIDMAGALKAAE